MKTSTIQTIVENSKSGNKGVDAAVAEWWANTALSAELGMMERTLAEMDEDYISAKLETNDELSTLIAEKIADHNAKLAKLALWISGKVDRHVRQSARAESKELKKLERQNQIKAKIAKLKEQLEEMDCVVTES